MQTHPKALVRINRATLLTSSLGLVVVSQAAPMSWSGASGTNATAWADGANWAGTAPANSLTTDTALFDLADFTGKQPNAGTRSVAGLQIGTGSFTGELTISGTALSLGVSGIDMKANAAATTISAPITLGANQTWASASVNDLSISGAISGTADLTRSGTGIVRLTGTDSNTFAGAFKISTLGGAGNINSATTYFNKTGGAVAVPANTVMTFGITTNGQGNVDMGSSGQFGNNVELKFGNNNGQWARFSMRGTNQTLAGLSAGVVSDTTQKGAVVQNRYQGNTTASSFGPASLTLNGSGNYTYYGYLRSVDGGTVGTDTLSLVKSGSGTQTLVGSQITYTGATTVNSGTLEFAKTSALNTSIANGATVVINSISGDDWTLSNGTTLSGAGIWRKTGAGRATFGNATLTTSGKFEIQNGTLRNNNNAGNWSGSTADMDISAGAILDLFADAVFVDELTGSGVVLNGYGNASGQTGASANYEKLVVGVANGSSTFSGEIRDNGSFTPPANGTAGGGVQLDKTGTGTLTLSGANSYTGPTNLLGGTLALAGGSAIADTGSVVLADASGAQLRLDANETIGALAGGGAAGGNVNLQGNTLTLAGNASNTFGGVISGSGGSLTKAGTGTLGLSGASTHSGTTAIQAGTLNLTGSLANSALSVADGAFLTGEGAASSISIGSSAGAELVVNPSTAGALTASGGLAVNGVALVSLHGPVTTPNFKVINFGSNTSGFTAANFDLVSSSGYRSYSFAVNAGNVSLTLQSKSLEWTGAVDAYWDVNFSENWVDTSTSSPEKFFAADHVLFGNAPATNQVISVYEPVTPSSVTVNSAVNYTFSGSPINGGAALLKAGTGSLTLSSANGFSSTVIRHGEIRTSNNSSLGSGTVTLGDASTGSSAVSWLWGGSGGQNPANNVVVSSQGTGTVTLGTHAGPVSTPGLTMTLNRPVSINDSTADRTSFSGKISGNVGVITLTGNRVTFSNSANDFVGDVVVSANTIYQNDGAGAVPDGTSFTLLGSGSRFRLNSNSEAIGALNGNGIVDNVTGSGYTLTVGGGNASGSFAGSVTNGSGTLNLAKTGLGSQVFTGAMTHTGPTAVNGGTLQLPSGVTLSGGITAADGTTLAVGGGSAPTLTTTTLALGTSSGATLDLKNFAGSTTVPLVNATTSLAASGSIVVKVSGASFSTGTYPLLDYAGAASGATFTLDASSLPRGVTASLFHDTANTRLDLVVSTAASLVWVGDEASPTWDINTTQNWKLSGTDSVYLENDQVLFDDSATGGTSVTISGMVHPTAMTFGNSVAKAYTLGGGTIGGAGGLSKTGDGLLTLTGAHTFTGVTTVNSGTLNLGDGVTNGSVGGMVNSNATVNFNTLGTVTHAGGFGGTGTINKKQSGTLVATGTSSHTGTVNVDGGTMEVSSGGGFGGSTYVLAPNTRLYLNYGAAVGTTATGGYLSKITGSGTVELNSAQAVNGSANWGPNAASSTPWAAGFTGTLVISRGRTDSPPAGLGGMSKMIVKDGGQFLGWTGTYELPFEIAGNGWGESGQAGAFRVAGGHSAIFNGGITLTADAGINSQTSASSMTINGVISGAFGITKVNAGPLILGGANTYSGKTTVSGGSIRLDHQLALQNSTLASGGVSFGTTSANYLLGGLEGSGGLALQNTSAAPVTVSIGNNDATTTHTGVISGTGHIVKTGSGTLSLDGFNTYTGSTTVEEGTLSVFYNYFHDSSTVSIASGAKLDLDTEGASDTVSALVLGGASMPQGTYNATTHPAYFTGTGSIVVGGAFESWAASKGLDGTPGKENGLTNDPDKDGMENLTEFYLDGNPLASDHSILPAASIDASYITLTFHRRDDAEASVLTQVVQYGSNLSTWANATITAATSTDPNGVIVTVVENGSGADDITVKIPRALNAGGKLFGRLQVTK